MWKDILFSNCQLNSQVRIVKLGEGANLYNQNYQGDLKKMVELLDDNYPGIDIWYNKKVVPGLKEKERIAYLVYYDNLPVGMTIIKRDNDESKLCSMRLNQEYQNKGIGNLLISLVGRELRSVSKQLYFTAPEKIYNDHKMFFEKMGFVFRGEAGTQYRLFDKEIQCSVSTDVLWSKITLNLPKLISQFTLDKSDLAPDLVISIRPEFADKIKKLSKTVEIRKKFDKKWAGSFVLLYETAPSAQFIGEAKIFSIEENTPSEIWNKYSESIGIDKGKYSQYCENAEKVSALVLNEINIFNNPISKLRIEHLLEKELNAPQSHLDARKGNSWPTAVLLNYLLLA